MGHIAGDNGPKRLVDEYIEKVRTQTIYREAVKDLSDPKILNNFQDLADHGEKGRPYKILTDEVCTVN